MPPSSHTHKSMLLRGAKLPPVALTRSDIEIMKGKARRGGRSYGRAPLRRFDPSSGRQAPIHYGPNGQTQRGGHRGGHRGGGYGRGGHGQTFPPYPSSQPPSWQPPPPGAPGFGMGVPPPPPPTHHGSGRGGGYSQGGWAGPPPGPPGTHPGYPGPPPPQQYHRPNDQYRDSRRYR